MVLKAPRAMGEPGTRFLGLVRNPCFVRLMLQVRVCQFGSKALMAKRSDFQGEFGIQPWGALALYSDSAWRGTRQLGSASGGPRLVSAG